MRPKHRKIKKRAKNGRKYKKGALICFFCSKQVYFETFDKYIVCDDCYENGNKLNDR
jgi:hypothetical protein